jgi:hypothetical protein
MNYLTPFNPFLFFLFFERRAPREMGGPDVGAPRSARQVGQLWKMEPTQRRFTGNEDCWEAIVYIDSTVLLSCCFASAPPGVSSKKGLGRAEKTHDPKRFSPAEEKAQAFLAQNTVFRVIL